MDEVLVPPCLYVLNPIKKSCSHWAIKNPNLHSQRAGRHENPPKSLLWHWKQLCSCQRPEMKKAKTSLLYSSNSELWILQAGYSMNVLSPGIRKVAEIFIAPVSCGTTLCIIFVYFFLPGNNSENCLCSKHNKRRLHHAGEKLEKIVQLSPYPKIFSPLQEIEKKSLPFKRSLNRNNKEMQLKIKATFYIVSFHDKFSRFSVKKQCQAGRKTCNTLPFDDFKKL